MLRSVLMSVIVALGSCGPPTETAHAENRERVLPGDVSAARRVLQDMLVDSGALEEMTRRALVRSGEQAWAAWSANPDLAEVVSPHSDEIRSYLATEYPSEGTRETLSAAPAVLDTFAPRLAAFFSDADLQELHAFYGSAEGRSWFLHAAIAGDEGYTPTAQEARALAEFQNTTAAQYVGATPTFNEIIARTGIEAVAARSAVIRSTMLMRVCEILGEDCPDGFTSIGDEG
jgi:hypothetical protein